MVKDEAGNTYGRLRVIRRDGSRRGLAVWLCVCTCGAQTAVTGDALRSGRIKSCGCYRRSGDYNRKHGHASYPKGVTPTYRSWQEMHNRCRNPSSPSYKNYGAKGVTVDPRWGAFEAFLEDMGERPAGTTLDRLDNAKGYSKSNCQWSNRRNQALNRSCTVRVEYRGTVKALTEWCELLSLPYPRTYYRLRVKGMTADEAFNPSKVDRRKT